MPSHWAPELSASGAEEEDMRELIEYCVGVALVALLAAAVHLAGEHVPEVALVGPTVLAVGRGT